MKSEMIQGELEMFKATGFFFFFSVAIQHIKDFIEISNKHNIDYCLMFGLLLGLLRHQDFIPWDDDIDIVFIPVQNLDDVLAPVAKHK